MRRLAKEKSISSAELALIGPGLQPPVPAAAFAPSERPPGAAAPRAKSFLTGEALPCASVNDWSLTPTAVKEAWQLAPNMGAGIAIAHPDTGYTHHPEFGPTFLRTIVFASIGATTTYTKTPTR